MSKGKKHLKKKHSAETVEAADLIKAQKRRENRKYILPLIINSIVFLGLYWLLTNYSFWNTVMWIYWALTLGFLVAYIIYNRGFSRKGVTPEMLPDTMSFEEKQEFIADGERRMKKSKWMLTIILPLVLTFCLDMFVLFVAEPILSNM